MAADSPSTEYLCDFIYLDRGRAALYAAQLSEDGGTPSLVKKIHKDSGADKHVIAAGIPKILSGEHSGSVQHESSLEGHFDPAWMLPLDVLNKLHELNYITTDLASAYVGGLALLTCNLRIIDVRMLREIWPHVGELMTQKAIEELPSSTAPKIKQQIISQQKKGHDMMASIVSKLPHALQGVFYCDGERLWTTLNPDCMLVNPEDIAFKHGTDVAGEWKVLGIVDALPASDVTLGSQGANAMEEAMAQVLNALRQFMGRDADSYGITPILIFRVMKQVAVQ